ECRATGPGRWILTWKVAPADSGRPVARFELRIEDGGFFVTVAEVEPTEAANGFELCEEQLSARIISRLQASGSLRARVAAVGRGGAAQSEEVRVCLWETEVQEGMQAMLCTG
ncbi:unnamed protein product, partial [Symbiodinium pilosum]